MTTMFMQLVNGNWMHSSGKAPLKGATAILSIDPRGLTAMAEKAANNDTGVSRDGPLTVRTTMPIKKYEATFQDSMCRGPLLLQVEARTEKSAKHKAARLAEKKIADGYRCWPNGITLTKRVTSI